MEQDKIVFKINKSESIVIQLPQPLNNLFRYDEVTIYYVNNNKKYAIFDNDFIIYALRTFLEHLKQLLLGNLKLHRSIKKDIGYLWNKKFGRACNEYIKGERIRFTYLTSNEGRKFWIGTQYHVWGAKAADLWFYEKNKQIFLEVTPHYKYFIPKKEAQKDPNYVSFKEFMQNYKPLVVTIIERSKLAEWQKEIERLISLVEANDSKYFCNENCKHD